MKPHVMRMGLAALLTLLAPLAFAQDVSKLVAGITSANPDERAEAWKSAGPYGAAAVLPLGEQLAAADANIVRAASLALDNVVDHATRPGAAAEKAAVAAELAKLLDKARPEGARREAVRLLAMCATDAETSAIGALLAEPALAMDACLTLQQTGTPAAGSALVAALPSAPAELQARMAAALGHINYEGSIEALKGLTKSADPAVHDAALDSLAGLGVAPRTFLVSTKSWTPEKRDPYCQAALTAADVIGRQEGAGDRANKLYSWVAKNAAAPHQVAAALVGLARTDAVVAAAVPQLENPEVRDIAVDVLSKSESPGVDDQLAKAYGTVGAPSQAAILAILSGRKSPALQALLPQAQNASSAELRVAAAEAAGTAPAPEVLFEAAQSGSDWGREHAAALYVDAAAELEKTNATAAVAAYTNIIRAAAPPNVKVAAFNGLERLASPETVEFLKELRPLYNPASGQQPGPEAAKIIEEIKSNSALAVAAGRSYVAAAATLPKEVALPELQAALDNVQEYDVMSATVEKLAAYGLDPRVLGQQRGFITDWKLLGPFGNEEGAAFQKDFFTVKDEPMPDAVALETGNTTAAAMATQGVPAVVNLHEHFQTHSNVAAYGYAEVKSAQEQPVQFLLGSDDGCELWLNGQKIFETNAARGMIVDGDKVPATLRAGVNRVLIKVLQGSGDWQYVVRVATPEGKPVDLTQQP